MSFPIRSVIAATGSYIPPTKISNESFANHRFYDQEGLPLRHDQATVIEKFKAISGIEERRYAQSDQQASDLGFLAAQNALESSGIDPESLDYLIVAHNFGDIAPGTNRTTQVPSLASRIKARLQIKNPACVAYDLAFGCPGWLEGVIQANYYIRAGDARRCLIIGSETLSRITDPFDRDSMLFGDGAGALILEAATGGNAGVLAHCTQTHAFEHAQLLSMGVSNAPQQADSQDLFMKMNGRKLYELALNHVPLVIKLALDKAAIPLSAISKVLIHQANEKMDRAILHRLFKLYDMPLPPEALMPMTLSWLGNSSVATIPTLLDLLLKGSLESHQINPDDQVVFASVGAGMNINALVYRF
ncbi:3-oxoacyl-[acyl-carrier-protein] synthase-3 [Larkinella arboricola]|uniref:3-oxoacyl-[acyl-carrier-protein] synthase-3 n=1 Tax=Larkinella arboricola TaxID=643671 RepID=A0A327WNA8_LARAB|nr:ketoacyl-ACP synthase III [Larkinella arboricola]RAJ93085.1 3-oxoacyl-[acyl-carrier-protein] synthase-3 [Larkinella arboricola]